MLPVQTKLCIIKIKLNDVATVTVLGYSELFV